MDSTNPLSVDIERNDNLKKVKFENGFYNIVNGEKILLPSALASFRRMLDLISTLWADRACAC